MRLRLSIKNSLFFALLSLAALLLLAIAFTWRAFSLVEEQQQQLIEMDLPKFKAVGEAVDDGLALLDIGFLLSRELNEDEYEQIVKRASALIVKMKASIDLLSQDEAELPIVAQVRRDETLLIEAIEQELDLRRRIIENNQAYNLLRLESKSKTDKAIIGIKLTGTSINSADLQMVNAANELIFIIERMEEILDSLVFVDSFNVLRQERHQYRLLINRLSVKLLEFPVEFRRELSLVFSPLLQLLTDDQNLFALMLKQLALTEELNVYQQEIARLSILLNEEYREISLDASHRIETDASLLVVIVASSKKYLLVFFGLFLLLVLIFFYWFVRPRISVRLNALNQSTLNIANGKFAEHIDTTGHDEISEIARSLACFREELVHKESNQQALINSEKRLSTIIQNASEGLFTVDSRGLIISLNPACESIFGGRPSQLIGRAIADYLPQQSDLFKHHNSQAIAREGAGFLICNQLKVAGNKLSGDQFSASLSVTLIRLGDQLIYSCFVRDMTAEERSKQHLDDLVQQLSASNAELERFAYSCSHDLQEPIRMVSSFGDLLQKHLQETQKIDKQTEDYLNFITQGALTAKQLVADILAYSRLEKGVSQKEWQLTSEVFDQLHVMMHNLLQEKNAICEVVGGEIKVLVIPALFKQLLMNLIVNGIKYNESEQPKVMVAVVDESDCWVITVKDNGIGIAPEYQEKVFDLFTRLVSRRDYSGSGIGLALCKKIVGKHNGSIRVISAAGEGACFEVKLPKN